jgi:hypothetical protein
MLTTLTRARANKLSNDAVYHCVSTCRNSLRGNGSKRMLYCHHTRFWQAIGDSVCRRRIHEYFRTQYNRGDTTAFEFNSIVHTARHTGASISNSRDNKVAVRCQLLQDLWLSSASINELVTPQDISEMKLGVEHLTDTSEECISVILAIVEKTSHSPVQRV